MRRIQSTPSPPNRLHPCAPAPPPWAYQKTNPSVGCCLCLHLQARCCPMMARCCKTKAGQARRRGEGGGREGCRLPSTWRDAPKVHHSAESLEGEVIDPEGKGQRAPDHSWPQREEVLLGVECQCEGTLLGIGNKVGLRLHQASLAAVLSRLQPVGGGSAAPLTWRSSPMAPCQPLPELSCESFSKGHQPSRATQSTSGLPLQCSSFICTARHKTGQESGAAQVLGVQIAPWHR
jgi:hypothetical protein